MHQTLELFYRHFCAKALVLVNPTELELFYRHFCAKALVLVNPKELEFLSCVVRAEILTIFCSYFGRNDDFKNSF